MNTGTNVDRSTMVAGDASTVFVWITKLRSDMAANSTLIVARRLVPKMILRARNPYFGAVELMNATLERLLVRLTMKATIFA